MDINVTTHKQQNIFVQKDIRKEIENLVTTLTCKVHPYDNRP